MNTGELLDLWREAMVTVGWVSAPFVLGALVIGIATSLLQAATQMQDNIFSFVPKLAVVGVALALLGNLMLDRLASYTKQAFESTIEADRPSP